MILPLAFSPPPPPRRIPYLFKLHLMKRKKINKITITTIIIIIIIIQSTLNQYRSRRIQRMPLIPPPLYLNLRQHLLLNALPLWFIQKEEEE
jgi:hypothetical protein